jgi:putative methionine-R-sulfoxide reductase with GAF domain
MGREIGQRTLTVLSGLANALGALGLALGGIFSGHFKTELVCFVGGGLFLAFTPIVTGFVTVTREERLRSMTLFAELTHKVLELEKKHDVRVTVFEVTNSKKKGVRLVQRARYGGEGHVKPSRSFITAHQGVAGKCYREGKVFVVSFPSGDFQNHMVKWGFTKEEAQKFQERGAFICTPILGENEQVIGVLSVDAKTPGVFSSEHADLAERLTPFFTRLLTEPGR